jgi:hypothetical protein
MTAPALFSGDSFRPSDGHSPLPLAGRAAPECVREMRVPDTTGLLSDDLVSMRIHNVTTEFVRQIPQSSLACFLLDLFGSAPIRGLFRSCGRFEFLLEDQQ